MTALDDWTARAHAEADSLMAEHEWAIGNREALRMIVALAWMIGHNAGSKETRATITREVATVAAELSHAEAEGAGR